ncbi:MAG: hypothetical protein IPJ65_08810 [Archangiaceae bacterium]|nr:hypothetical protein [Archangiaceae bacterium]
MNVNVNVNGCVSAPSAATGAFCALTLVLASCGSGAQAKDEASIVYRIKFSAEEGASTSVTFPLPSDAALTTVQSAIAVTDGGTIDWVREDDQLITAKLAGHGIAEATFSVKNLKGFPEGSGAPEATLSFHQPDAGPGDLYVRVNKGGFPTANVEFEYTASRDCGSGCGGKRSWTFSGDVGLALQPVHMNYVEEHR